MAVIGGGFRYIRVIPTFLSLKDNLNLDSCGTFNNNNCLNNTACFYSMRSGQDKINITVLMRDENQQILFFQQVSGIPSTQQRLTLVVIGIFSLQNDTHFNLNTAKNYSIHVEFRECKIGEIYTKIGPLCEVCDNLGEF
ncbi:hypothetical protein ABPG72_011060 [Tetrahymena utriculariae]